MFSKTGHQVFIDGNKAYVINRKLFGGYLNTRCLKNNIKFTKKKYNKTSSNLNRYFLRRHVFIHYKSYNSIGNSKFLQTVPGQHSLRRRLKKFVYNIETFVFPYKRYYLHRRRFSTSKKRLGIIPFLFFGRFLMLRARRSVKRIRWFRLVSMHRRNISEKKNKEYSRFFSYNMFSKHIRVKNRLRRLYKFRKKLRRVKKVISSNFRFKRKRRGLRVKFFSLFSLARTHGVVTSISQYITKLRRGDFSKSIPISLFQQKNLRIQRKYWYILRYRNTLWKKLSMPYIRQYINDSFLFFRNKRLRKLARINANLTSKSKVKSLFILKNFKKIFYMLRRRLLGFGNSSFYFDRRESSVRLNRSLFRSTRQSRFREDLRRERIRTRQSHFYKTAVVVRSRRNNTFLSINRFSAIVFKVSRGAALRYVQKVERPVGVPKRKRRGVHDRASKKERKSIIGHRSFYTLVDSYFRSRPLEGFINVYFYGRVSRGLYFKLSRFMDRVLSWTYKKQINILRIILKQRLKLKLIYRLLKAFELRLMVLRLISSSKMLRYLSKHISTYDPSRLFFSFFPYRFLSGIRNFSDSRNLSSSFRLYKMFKQIVFLVRGIRWRFKKKRAEFLPCGFTHLNLVRFSPPTPHRKVFRYKKARRV